MSDTPRTDAAVKTHRFLDGSNELHGDFADFARILERELAALRAQVEALTKERNELGEYLWPNQTGLPNEHRNCLLAVKTRERLMKEQIESLTNKINEVKKAEMVMMQVGSEAASQRDQVLAQVAALREAVRGMASMPEYDQDDAHRLRHKAQRALALTGPFPPVVRVDEVLPVLLEIINHQPSCEGGGCFYPRHDGEGNYIGEENVDPIGVIQAMSTLASALITKLEAMK